MRALYETFWVPLAQTGDQLPAWVGPSTVIGLIGFLIIYGWRSARVAPKVYAEMYAQPLATLRSELDRLRRDMERCEEQRRWADRRITMLVTAVQQAGGTIPDAFWEESSHGPYPYPPD